jgi:hypothetical protein
MDKAPAKHMLEWHQHLVTGESNRYLLDIAGPNLDILAPRGSAKSTVLNMFTAWIIGRHTTAGLPLQIIYCSYNIATAIPKSRIIKQIIDSSTYKKIFPKVVGVSILITQASAVWATRNSRSELLVFAARLPPNVLTWLSSMTRSNPALTLKTRPLGRR